MKSLVRKYFPVGLQSWLRRTYYRYPLLRRLYYLPQDAAQRLRRGGDSITPPRSLISVGDGDFAAIGGEFLGYFKNLAGLQPNEKVLEIGCGVGRMAIPLTTFLSDQGEYVGFDIVRPEIRWCQKRITPRFPNFHFHYIDIRNEQTNRRGRQQASSCRFPFTDGRFDFVFLTSVFTHMLLEDIGNYLLEISRALKPNGRMLATCFLLDPPARERLKKMNSRFRHAHGDSLAIDPKLPEASIAHEETAIRKLFEKSGLAIQDPVRFGNWNGREHYLSSQDIIVARKNAAG